MSPLWAGRAILERNGGSNPSLQQPGAERVVAGAAILLAKARAPRAPPRRIHEPFDSEIAADTQGLVSRHAGCTSAIRVSVRIAQLVAHVLRAHGHGRACARNLGARVLDPPSGTDTDTVTRGSTRVALQAALAAANATYSLFTRPTFASRTGRATSAGRSANPTGGAAASAGATAAANPRATGRARCARRPAPPPGARAVSAAAAPRPGGTGLATRAGRSRTRCRASSPRIAGVSL
jgi:hypothetical protein